MSCSFYSLARSASFLWMMRVSLCCWKRTHLCQPVVPRTQNGRLVSVINSHTHFPRFFSVSLSFVKIRLISRRKIIKLLFRHQNGLPVLQQDRSHLKTFYRGKIHQIPAMAAEKPVA